MFDGGLLRPPGRGGGGAGDRLANLRRARSSTLPVVARPRRQISRHVNKQSTITDRQRRVGLRSAVGTHPAAVIAAPAFAPKPQDKLIVGSCLQGGCYTFAVWEFFFFLCLFFVCKNALIYRDGRKWQINGASCLCGLDVRRITKDFQSAVKKKTPREVDQKPEMVALKDWAELVKYSTCTCKGWIAVDVCKTEAV